MIIIIAAIVISPMITITNIATKSMTTVTMTKVTCIIKRKSIIMCTIKAGMRKNMSMKRKRSRISMIISIMTTIINATTITIMNMQTITDITAMKIFMKKSLNRKRWLPRTYTCITTMIIVMRWRAIIAIMIVGMTTTMTMITLTIKPLQGYQRGTSSISTKSMAM